MPETIHQSYTYGKKPKKKVSAKRRQLMANPMVRRRMAGGAAGSISK